MSTNTHPTQPTNTQPPAAAPAAQPVDEPLKNWAFPFTPLDSKLDASDPMTYMKALASAEDGFFPLGANGMVHGGIHFDQNTAKLLNQDEGVRAIADGEVVAYRLDSAYPEQVYRDGRHAYYSTSFVLIRHKLALPPLPARAAASTTQGQTTAQPASGAQGAAPPKKAAPDETLTFFSLYMHLTDYATYQAAQTKEGAADIDTKKLNLASMPYWQGDRYYRVGDKAQDKQAVPKPNKPTPAPSPTYDPLGAFIDDNYTVPPSPVDDEPPPPPPVVGLRICNPPNGKMIGVLPKGAELIASDTETHPGWVKIKSLKSGQPVAAVVGKTVDAHAPWSWVPLAGLDLVVDPQPRDTVVVLKDPHPVKAGDVVGEPGHYLRYTDSKLLKGKGVRSVVHLEVFAGQELKAFIDKSRQRATEARNAEKQAKDGRDLPGAKTILEISPGARPVTSFPDPDQKVQPPSGGLKLDPVAPARGCRWVLVQPKEQQSSGGHHPHVTFRNVGTKIWVDASIANTTVREIVSGWTNFPLSLSNAGGASADFRQVFRRADLDKLGAENIAVDDNGQHWWNVILGTKDGALRKGWICEDNHPLTRMCGPWDWPGFELIDNREFKPVDMIKRYLHATDQYLPGEDKSSFEPSALTVNAGELIVKLEKALDQNHDGKITAQELKHAQEIAWSAEALSHFIVRSETEWGGGLGKWDALSPLMKNLLWLWQCEVERIGKLQWWEQASAIDGFPTDLAPWHFHPIGLIWNFSVACSEECKTEALDFPTTEGTFYSSREAFALVLKNEGYGETPYVPASSASSGVTVGYGYDLGQQTRAQATTDFSGIYSQEQIARLLTAIGKHGSEARALIPSLHDIKISQSDAVELAKRMKRRYAQYVVDIFPGITNLHPHCQGALLSLVVNRGNGLVDKPHQLTREHMRNIRKDFLENNISDVPVQIRAMKVLWDPNTLGGLVKRREQEAQLFDKGMHCNCWR